MWRIPSGLDAYYERVWQVLSASAKKDWDTWARLYEPVIATLACAEEPVTADWLADHTGLGASEIVFRALEPWESFLMVDGLGRARTWRIIHPTFRGS